MNRQTQTDRPMNRQTDRQTDEQTDRQTDEQADTDRQMNRQTNRQTCLSVRLSVSVCSSVFVYVFTPGRGIHQTSHGHHTPSVATIAIFGSCHVPNQNQTNRQTDTASQVGTDPDSVHVRFDVSLPGVNTYTDRSDEQTDTDR